MIAAIVAYATSLIHEFCHGIAFPDRGAAKMYFSSQFKSVPGLRYLANGFITTDRPFHKGRFLMGLAMPVIITVLIPLAVFTYLLVLHKGTVALKLFLLSFSIIELISCCSDIKTFFRVLFFFPKNKPLRLHGTAIYYR